MCVVAHIEGCVFIMTPQEIFELFNPPFDATVVVENESGTRKIVFPCLKVKFSVVECEEENNEV